MMVLMESCHIHTPTRSIFPKDHLDIFITLIRTRWRIMLKQQALVWVACFKWFYYLWDHLLYLGLCKHEGGFIFSCSSVHDCCSRHWNVKRHVNTGPL